MATPRPKAKPAAAFPTAMPRPTLALPPDHAEDKARHPYEPKQEAPRTTTVEAKPKPERKPKAAKPAGEEEKVPWATRLPKERTRQVKAYCALHDITIEQAADAALRLLMETHPNGLPE